MERSKIDFTMLAGDICAEYPELDTKAYINYLTTIYGGLPFVCRETAGIDDEIISIERDIRSNDINIPKVTTPEETVRCYFDISFYLARCSHLENCTFKIAAPLKALTEHIYNNLLNDKQKNSLRKDMSESVLDFVYAQGDHSITSLRLASIMRRR